MKDNSLGKIYQHGEVVFRQGERGDLMYVIQEGKVEIVRELNGKETILAVRVAGDFFGEMGLFEKETRMATVRALGEARILTVDKKNLMRRIHEDPSLAYQIIRTLSKRVRELSEEVGQLETWLLEAGLVEVQKAKSENR